MTFEPQKVKVGRVSYTWILCSSQPDSGTMGTRGTWVLICRAIQLLMFHKVYCKIQVLSM